MDFLEAGIRAENLRQKAIANNIANLETPGYRRIDIKFEELLTKCLKSEDTNKLARIVPEIYRPEQTPVKSNGNDVNYEAEVGQMIRNTIRHKAFIRLLNKKYKQIVEVFGYIVDEILDLVENNPSVLKEEVIVFDALLESGEYNITLKEACNN